MHVVTMTATMCIASIDLSQTFVLFKSFLYFLLDVNIYFAIIEIAFILNKQLTLIIRLPSLLVIICLSLGQSRDL